MTPIVLIDELIAFIVPVVANLELQSNVPGIKKAPEVMGGYLPEKKPGQKQDPPDFPFVIVRYIDDDDHQEGDHAKVKILAGTYSEDTQDGWRDALNVITRIKSELLKQPFFEAFKVMRPIKIELPEEQPYPEWIAIMTITVAMPQIIEEGSYQDEFE